MPRAKIQSGYAAAAPTGRRIPRRPSHPFQLKVRPWQLQPFFIAPVLPGETMKNLLVQARIVSDPVNHPLIGWWAELYFFYVKHRDLPIRDQLTAMMIDPAFSMASSGLQEANSTKYYHIGPHINWTKRCTERCVDEYFRMENEVAGSWVIDGMPLASVNPLGVLDTLRLQSEYDALDQPLEGPDADTVIDQSEVETALARWQLLRFNNLTDMTYEEYLSSYGVRTADTELHIPELIRYVRDWQYPTSHVEPTTGIPSSALSWKLAERADKDRYFSEPGFIIGLQCIRPKVYMGNVKGSFCHMMESALSWLPSPLTGNTPHSLIQVPAGVTGPIVSSTGTYSFDVRDLMLYGDQFLNFDSQALGTNGAVALPSGTDMQKRYASAADADGLFKTGTANTIRTDGRVDLTILGRQTDLTGTS